MLWFIIILILIAILIWGLSRTTSDGNNSTNSLDFINNPEFCSALNEARKIKSFFEKAAAKQNGSVMIVTNNIDNPDNIDWSLEKYSSLVYFRVCLPFGYSAYTLDELKNSSISDEERNALINSYLLNNFCASKEEIAALGLDPYDIVYDMVQGDEQYEGILYYKFLCPCGLKGNDRDIFINSVKE